MSIELWYGAKTEKQSEQQVLVELYNFLQGQSEHYVVLCNFRPPNTNEIDLLVLKPGGCFLAEVKHYWSKIIGEREGDWRFVQRNGEERPFGNPFKQVLRCSHGWQDWVRDSAVRIQQATGCAVDPRRFEPKPYVVFSPTLEPSSEINVGDYPVRIVGIKEFQRAIVMLSNPNGLTRTEIQALPNLLNLTQWHIEPPAGGPVRTVQMGDYKPAAVRMLVARGHDFSAPVFHLEKDVITVGRTAANDLLIDHGSVSQRHAELVREGGRWVVKDLGSTNGTWVSFNGDPRTERQIDRENALKNGSIVRFGQAAYTLLLSD